MNLRSILVLFSVFSLVAGVDLTTSIRGRYWLGSLAGDVFADKDVKSYTYNADDGKCYIFNTTGTGETSSGAGFIKYRVHFSTSQKAVIITFGGKSAADVKSDDTANTVSGKTATLSSAPYLVAQGFADAYLTFKNLKQTLDTLQTTYPRATWDYHLNGYGGGGAMAVLAAVDLGLNDYIIVTFGTPRIGQAIIAKVSTFTKFHRYVLYNDRGAPDCRTQLPAVVQSTNVGELPGNETITAAGQVVTKPAPFSGACTPRAPGDYKTSLKTALGTLRVNCEGVTPKTRKRQDADGDFTPVTADVPSPPSNVTISDSFEDQYIVVTWKANNTNIDGTTINIEGYLIELEDDSGNTQRIRVASDVNEFTFSIGLEIHTIYTIYVSSIANGYFSEEEIVYYYAIFNADPESLIEVFETTVPAGGNISLSLDEDELVYLTKEQDCSDASDESSSVTSEHTYASDEELEPGVYYFCVASAEAIYDEEYAIQKGFNITITAAIPKNGTVCTTTSTSTSGATAISTGSEATTGLCKCDGSVSEGSMTRVGIFALMVLAFIAL